MTPSPGKALLAAAVLLGAAAPPLAAQAGAAQAVALNFEQYQLPNGLRVILLPDPTTPVVAVNLWYNAGSRNERAGRTGFAHLFEHMMFGGSENVPKGDHFRLLREAGATNLNASTTEDRTNYYQVVPPHRLNLALWLEAERMRSLDVTAEALRTEQEVVKEERRLRVDNAPYTSSFLRAVYDAAYNRETCFPYSHDVIGSMTDLDAAELADVQQFFRTYYAPNNATLTLVGDFEPAAARALVAQYFGPIPSQPAPPAVTCETPFTHLPVRQVVNDPNATLPATFLTFGTVPFGHADQPALTLLYYVLANGESSRLNQRLAKQERAAAAVAGQPFFRRGPGVMLLYAVANQGQTPERLEQLLNEEIQKVIDGGITAEELERARNQYSANQIRGLTTAMGKAEAIQQYALFGGDATLVNRDLERYRAVTREDVQRVARQYLNAQNRVTILTQPGQGGN